MMALALRRPLDFIALMKPRITLMVLFTNLLGFFLAGGSAGRKMWLAVAGTVLVIGCANTLNMYLERDSDGLMRRTRNRPIPAGRITPNTALWFGLALGAVSLPILAFGVNLLTAILGAIALLSYVLVYTPMKKRSPISLLIGAVPGAIPPLMGWTAATDRLELPGVILFAIMFVWQVPHFLAITLYAPDDFARGGIKTLPFVSGVPAAKRRAAIFAAVLVPVSLGLVPLHVAGHAYLAVALFAGTAFFGWSAWGLRKDAGTAWARSLFIVSLVYLTLLFVVLGATGSRVETHAESIAGPITGSVAGSVADTHGSQGAAHE